MTKAKEFFEEELSGEPLTQEQVIWALEKFARLAWSDGWTGGWIRCSGGGEAGDCCDLFLSKSYSERDKEMVNIEKGAGDAYPVIT